MITGSVCRHDLSGPSTLTRGVSSASWPLERWQLRCSVCDFRVEAVLDPLALPSQSLVASQWLKGLSGSEMAKPSNCSATASNLSSQASTQAAAGTSGREDYQLKSPKLHPTNWRDSSMPSNESSDTERARLHYEEQAQLAKMVGAAVDGRAAELERRVSSVEAQIRNWRTWVTQSAGGLNSVAGCEKDGSR